MAQGAEAAPRAQIRGDMDAELRAMLERAVGEVDDAPESRFEARRNARSAAEAAEGRLPLVAVGGVDSGAEAYARIRLGAGAVQIYSALVYEGPGLVGRIKQDLAKRLRADGFSTVSEAVGAAR